MAPTTEGWRRQIARPRSVFGRLVASISLLLLAACGGSGGGPVPETSGSTTSLLDTSLKTAANGLGLTGDPATPRGAVRVVPDDDPLVKLGQLLFFSQTFAGAYDVSCGTCHHPDFAGGDGLSIGVGVVPTNAAAVGPGREVDPPRDLDPAADGGPNMHRHSITTFNAALFDRVMLLDGRVQVVEDGTLPGGNGQLIKTPESGQRSDSDPVSGLLEFQAKGPVVVDNEMRGFLYTEHTTASEYRDYLIRRLRGEVDTEFNSTPDAATNWLTRFREAFDAPDGTTAELVTMANVQRAMGAYTASQIFVDTPWRDYLAGDSEAISEEARRGALLFLEDQADGGLGCISCHSGDRFTDEQFHNVGFPQLGRGFKRADKSDLGRWLVTQDEADLHAFRTPGLLNVAETPPYGHSGSFDRLADAIAYHADPRSGVEIFDFSLQALEQFRGSGVVYEHAEPHTRAAISAQSFEVAESRLPARPLTTTEIFQLVAFLESLSDRCVTDPECIGQWAPTAADDPDGHLLVRDASTGTPIDVGASSTVDYPELISLEFPATSPLPTFPDVLDCVNAPAGNNTGAATFVRLSGENIGLPDPHGYSEETWFRDTASVEVAMISGGVTAAYLDEDCWPDLIFAGGDAGTGMRTYRNLSGAGFEVVELLPGITEQRYTGAAVADLNGDYRRELLFGAVQGDVPVYAQNGTGAYQLAATLPIMRPTFGISFAPLDASGYPYFWLAHWGPQGVPGASPALWRSDGAALYPWDAAAGTTSSYVDQNFNFTPSFADFTGDGLIDLVITSDFNTSTTLRNIGNPSSGPFFVNETDRSVITDQNGMGAALIDIDNDRNLEWFVTSIFQTGDPLGNWGTSGNRLYRNVSSAGRMAFEDITDVAGVREGYWGWGVCAADFNNDGFSDLFHVNGFGNVPFDDDGVIGLKTQTRVYYEQLTQESFQSKPSLLFINEGDGTFSEQASSWNIAEASDGRGLACMDHDRDGDIDIVVLDHSEGLRFFENDSGSAAGRAFLNIRLVGDQPNTEALGAQVHVTADVGNSHGVQTQFRLSQANSNFSSQNTPDLHFGLGQAAMASTVRVVWPGGAETTCTDVAANQFIVLDERAPVCPSN